MRYISQQVRLEPMRRLRLRRAALWTAGIVAAGIAIAACGSSPPDAASPSAHGGTPATGLLAYASCMRSHGVPDFPDPASSGGIPKETGQQLGVSDSELNAAQNACQHVIPAGQSLSGQASQTITVQQQQDYLKVAACMRSHGFSDFPEPSFSAGQVEFPQLQHLVDVNSPQFTQAYHICQKLVPAGLPFSGSGG
jgi:hypothetical protein